MSREFMAEGLDSQEPEVIIPGEEKPKIKPFAKDHIPGMIHERNEETLRTPPTPREHQQAEATAREFLAKKVGEAVQRHAPKTVGVEPLKVAQEMLEQVHTQPDFKPGITPAELAMAGILPEIPPNMGVDGLREYVREQIEDYEANIGELTVEMVGELRAKVRNYDPHIIARPEREALALELTARLYSGLAEFYIKLAMGDDLSKLMGSHWSNEQTKRLREEEGVKEVIRILDRTDGEYFRAEGSMAGLSIKQRQERLAGDILRFVSSPEAAKTAVKLAIRLAHLTSMSGHWGGPKYPGGQLIEERITRDVFGSGRIDLRNGSYWVEWDKERRQAIRTIPSGPEGAAHDIPAGFKRGMYPAEYLEEINMGLPGLRHIAETRVRSMAAFKGLTGDNVKLGVLMELLDHDVVTSTGEKIPQFGGADWFYYFDTVRGALSLLKKYTTDEPRLLARGFDNPLLALTEPDKPHMPNILKPFLTIAAGNDYNYLLNYVYDVPGSASSEPMKKKAFDLYWLTQHLNSDEGQRFYKMIRLGEAGAANLLGRIPINVLTEERASRALGSYRPWGEIEIIQELETVRDTNVFDDEAFVQLENAFGVSRRGAAAKRGTKTVGDAIGKIVGEIFRGGSGVR